MFRVLLCFKKPFVNLILRLNRIKHLSFRYPLTTRSGASRWVFRTIESEIRSELRPDKGIVNMGKPTYLVWADGRKLTLDEIQQLTGLEIRRPAVNTRLRKAKLEGIPVSTLAQQIAVLTEHKRTPAQPGRDDAGDGGIPLSSRQGRSW